MLNRPRSRKIDLHREPYGLCCVPQVICARQSTFRLKCGGFVNCCHVCSEPTNGPRDQALVFACGREKDCVTHWPRLCFHESQGTGGTSGTHQSRAEAAFALAMSRCRSSPIFAEQSPDMQPLPIVTHELFVTRLHFGQRR